MKIGTVDEQLVDTAEEIRGFSRRNARRLVRRGLDEQSIFSPMKIGSLFIFPAETPKKNKGTDRR